MRVLLATRNGARWITEQVDSILGQSGVGVTIVVSDDGSVDDTREQVARVGRPESVRMISAAAPAISGAQNFFSLIRAQPAAGADFIAFADQDDLWHPDKLSRACAQLMGSGAAGYSSAVLAFWPSGRERLLRQRPARAGLDFLFEGAGQGCTFVLSAPFYARVRQFLRERPGLTRDLNYHDWAVYALARTWGLEWRFDPRPSLRYRQHGANDTGARASAAGVARRFSRVRSGWYRQQLEAIARLCHAAAPAQLHAAAGVQPAVGAWLAILQEPDGIRHRARMARLCLRSGRRRPTDRVFVALAACAGWI